MQGCHISIATKVLEVDLYAVQRAVPARNQTKNPTKNKRKQANKKHTTTTKPKQTQHREVGSQPAMGITCMMTSCVSLWEWPPNKKQNKENTETHKGAGKRVKEATKLNAEPRDPPSQDPRDHREQPFRHNVHPGTSKQTPTTPGRNESGEKRINGETGGETWSMVKNDSSSYGIQGALRVRSVVLFQSSSSLGAVVHSCGACCFQNCIQCDRVSDDR